ncbi:hypothetical protein [Pseudomonas sp. WS 5021]|jgi:hypothetical protein|nr:hypothetical protein [Pseudomonas sp. WS 5021]NMX64673.1 hypothetical protein [Pseudomonas sp. WS 5079]
MIDRPGTIAGAWPHTLRFLETTLVVTVVIAGLSMDLEKVDMKHGN